MGSGIIIDPRVGAGESRKECVKAMLLQGRCKIYANYPVRPETISKNCKKWLVVKMEIAEK